MAVRALNSLQNSMMFTPCCPSAGPTGGDGFALPAGLQLDDRGDLLHDRSRGAPRSGPRGPISDGEAGNRPVRCRYAFSTWAKSSSTGVARPNIETVTLTFCFSSFTSSTVAEKLANGPSIDADVLARFERRRAAWAFRPCPLAQRWSARPDLALRTGLGLVPPRKPVILGVFLTRWNVRSSRSIWTNM